MGDLKFGLLLVGLSLIGCGKTTTNERTGRESGEKDANQDAGDQRPRNSAIVVAGQAYTPEDYLTYVKVFPKVPTGNVDFEDFREFGNANVSTHNGYVFVEQEGTMTRFSVNEKLELVDEVKFSWVNFGVGAINASYNVFVSERRSYTFAPDLGLIIVWDPEEMTLVGTIDLDVPKRPSDLSTYAYDGHLVGDNVIWNVISDNWETGTIYPKATLAIADANSDAKVRFVEDDRCIPGGPSFVDANGDLYVHAGAEFGYFAAYGEQEVKRTCLLRVKSGDVDFDANYLLDYEKLTGTNYTYPWIHVTGQQWFTYAWDPQIELPKSPDEYWDNAAFRPLLVDLEDQTHSPYPDLAGGKQISAIQYEVDGQAYFEFSTTGYVESGETDVVALGANGIEQRFHLSGFLLALERLR